MIGVFGMREPLVREAVNAERLPTADKPPDEKGDKGCRYRDQDDVRDDGEQHVPEYPVPDRWCAISVHGARIHLLPLEEF